MDTPEQQYKKRTARFQQQLHGLEKAERSISNLRLAVFIAGIAAAAALYRLGYRIPAAIALFAAAAIFIVLVIRHEKLTDSIKRTSILRDINGDSLKRLQGEWNAFADTGEEFTDDTHRYTSDLDIFGKDSLFQWLNTAETYLGRCRLRDLLLGETGTAQEIAERQDAVSDLATKLAWRQELLAEALCTSKQLHNPDNIIAWAIEGNTAFRKPWVIAAVRICPLITVILSILGFGFNLLPWVLPALALLMQFAVLAFKSKERNRMFSIAERYAEDLRVYYKMLKHFEEQKFSSHLIKQIQQRLHNKEDAAAFVQIRRLSSLVDSIANRRNAFYLILNIIALWDFQHIIALELWKQRSGAFLTDWFDALAKIEALSSLAVIRYDNPDWAMPKIRTGIEPYLKADAVGHPLVKGRVSNDLALDCTTKVLLITGSNMSGKSTLLRTAGINLVLAYAGAPVCAKSFETSMLELYSCMRVADNLGENISSFYAELLRIKEIVTNAQEGKRVFFLLDEVFKGTNSRDRHTGAKVLINKLSTAQAIGLVSTHDLELCVLEKENERIANLHFQEYYQDGKIHFDYLLRPGPSTTRNALYLMQLAGIKVEETSDLK